MLCCSTWEHVPALGTGCQPGQLWWHMRVRMGSDHLPGLGFLGKADRAMWRIPAGPENCPTGHGWYHFVWQRDRLHSILLGMAATTHSIISTAYGVVCHHLYPFLCNRLFRNMCRIKKETEEYAGALDCLQIKMIGNGQIRVKHNWQPVKQSLCWTGTPQNPERLRSSCTLNTGLLCFVHVRFPWLTSLLGSVVSTAHIISVLRLHAWLENFFDAHCPSFVYQCCQGSITSI